MDPAPAPARGTSPGFWKRHRATILTIGLALYAVALGVGVTDDVFHLGLFPTRLERRAQRLIEQFDGPKDSRERAAADLVRTVDSFVAVPALIRALGSASPEVRATAVGVLRKITRASLGYDPNAPADQRREAIGRWRKWWQENKYRC